MFQNESEISGAFAVLVLQLIINIDWVSLGPASVLWVSMPKLSSFKGSLEHE